MRKKDVKKIKEVLKDNLGETKLLDEWVHLLNDQLPRNMRQTTREMAHIFCVFRKQGMFTIERTSVPPQYCFSSI